VNVATGLSPLGTALAAAAGASGAVARPDQTQIDLLDWLRPIRANLAQRFNLPEEIAYLAWELSRWPQGLDRPQRQSVILLILATLVQTQEGSTRLSLAHQLSPLIRDLTELDEAETARQCEAIRALIGAGRLALIAGAAATDFKPLIVAGEHVYLQKMLHLEDQLVAGIRARRDARIPRWPEAEVAAATRDVLARPTSGRKGPIALTSEQREAVHTAVNNPLTVISGGPGTGKTTIVLSILRVLKRLGVACEDFGLSAPTGKAAKRLGDAIRAGREQIAEPAAADLELAGVAEPRTLHRLLGYSSTTGRFLHHENNRLAERVVIVDESSMIDLDLMERLVRSVRDESRLILLGDAQQLPSVEAGTVLRDLLDAESLDGGPRRSAVVLTQSHRMRSDDPDGRNLLAVARAINEGALPDFAPARSGDGAVIECGSPAELTFHGVEFLPLAQDRDVLDRFLERWIAQARPSASELDKLVAHEYSTVGGAFPEGDEARLRSLFDHWERFCILCVSRVLPTGSDRINALLHRYTARSSGRTRAEDELVPGEPVMMQVNDYQRMIFNGDQGLVVNVADSGRVQPMAVFRRSAGFAAFQLDALRPSLQLSYAITVHKAQGSEFDRVAVVLPDRELPINTREILYTALTRARQSAVVLGSRDILAAAIRRPLARDSGIVEKLLSSR
jgi:exodeoxyribonuclease V alpha subunit